MTVPSTPRPAAPPRRRPGAARAGLVLGVAAAAVVATACSGGSSSPSSSSPAPSTSPAPSSSSVAPTSPPPAAKVNPLTGTAPYSRNPVVAVKIDDTAPGRPQLGIDKADVVYIEAVEGGLTRLAAVFDSTMPRAVGYVRSTRPSDPDLLLQYGKITEAYSGGAHDSLPRVHRSGITSWSNDAGAPYYSRINRSESDYINLAIDLAKVAAATKSPPAHSIGWTFSPSFGGLPSTRGTDVRTVVTGSYTGGTPVEFRYSPRIGRYVRYIDGRAQHAADGTLVTAKNVVVQSCRVVAHPQDTDINGNPSQFTYTVGKGAVSVFRGGRRFTGHWSRPKLTSGTSLVAANGHPIPLAPGNTWVVLIRSGVAVQG